MVFLGLGEGVGLNTAVGEAIKVIVGAVSNGRVAVGVIPWSTEDKTRGVTVALVFWQAANKQSSQQQLISRFVEGFVLIA